MKKKEKLVSIIVPVYNAEKFIDDTIKSILQQTYNNYELILVNDCSKDKTLEILKEYSKKDKRIKVIENKKNLGVALTRNNGIKEAKGEYICFIDADDKWDKDKLEKQAKFMENHKCAFSYTSYQFCDENCNPNGPKVIVPKTIKYRQALKNTTIWTSTVMFNMDKLTKNDILMPNVKSEDTALWWRILRTKVEKAYGIQDIYSYYRRTKGSLSANKFEAIKRVWHLYRKSEKLGIIYSLYNFCFYAFNAVRRRV